MSNVELTNGMIIDVEQLEAIGVEEERREPKGVIVPIFFKSGRTVLLRKENADKIRARVEFKTDVEELEALYRRLRVDLKKLKSVKQAGLKDLEEIGATTSDALTKIVDLKEEKKGLLEAVEGLKANVDELEAMRDRVVEEVNEAEAHRDELEGLKQAAQKELKEIDASISDSNTKQEGLLETITELETKTKELEVRSNELGNEIGIKIEIDELEDERNDLKEEIAELKAKRRDELETPEELETLGAPTQVE